MRAGDIVASPWTWVVWVICIAACWYAKRDLLSGFMVGMFAPIVLAAVWFASLLVLLLPYRLLDWVAPDAVDSVVRAFAGLPEAARHVLHPAALLTAALFALYCWSERANGGLPASHMPRTSQRDDPNPFSRRLRH